MNELVRKDALQSINEAIDILEQKSGRNILELKELSNHTIQNASIFQDDASLSLAVVMYAVSKLLERNPAFNCKKILDLFKKCQQALKDKDERTFGQAIHKLITLIEKSDDKLQLYVQEVIKKAQVKKGCTLCDHGISSARASELMGVSQWDIMNYMGKTTIQDNEHASTDVISRLKYTRRLFS